MKTINLNLFEFKELSDNAKKRALNDLQDINVDHQWWEDTYTEDAGSIGLKLTSSDFSYTPTAEGHFELAANEVAQNIFNNHGPDCETYKTAQRFMEVWEPVFNHYMETEQGEDELLKIEEEFLRDLLHDYAIILRDEFDYLTSEKAIIETIEANEYTFEENGKMRNVKQ